MTIAARASALEQPPPKHGGRSSTPYLLTAALAAVTAAGGGVTGLVRGVLLGEPVMNGSARGTGAILCLLGVPLLVAGAIAAARRSVRATLVWMAAATYITYNSSLLLLATPFNRLFLVYVAMFALGVGTLVTVAARLDVLAVAASMERVPARGLAVYIWVIAALNALTWLRNVIPALGTRGTPAFLRGSGLTTNPIYVQDLAFWLPLAAVVAWWLWQRRSWGLAVGAVWLVFWVIESITVATDQWFGAHADPSSTIATTAGCGLFVALSVVGLVPAGLALRHRSSGPGKAGL